MINATGTWETPLHSRLSRTRSVRWPSVAHAGLQKRGRVRRSARADRGRRHLGAPAARRDFLGHPHDLGDAAAAGVSRGAVRRRRQDGRRWHGGGTRTAGPAAKFGRLGDRPADDADDRRDEGAGSAGTSADVQRDHPHRRTLARWPRRSMSMSSSGVSSRRRLGYLPASRSSNHESELPNDVSRCARRAVIAARGFRVASADTMARCCSMVSRAVARPRHREHAAAVHLRLAGVDHLPQHRRAR